MNFKDFNSVIYLRKCDSLSDQQINFLTQLFHLKANDRFNINRLLIDLSFETKIKRTFGSKPHELLIYYQSLIKLNHLDTDFIRILDSIEDKLDYDNLDKDEKFFIIGNSRIGKLEVKQAKKINQLIDSCHFTTSQFKNSPCSHYRQYTTKK